MPRNTRRPRRTLHPLVPVAALLVQLARLLVDLTRDC